MFTQTEVSEPNKLQISQKYFLILFHIFGFHPLLKRTSSNISRILNYIPSCIILTFNITLIIFDIKDFCENTLSVAIVIRLWHSIAWNATMASNLIKIINNPLSLVDLLESMCKVDEIFLMRFKYNTDYQKIRWTFGLKLGAISIIYVATFLPYYITNYEYYPVKMMCFGVGADIYATVGLAFLLFYLILLNDRVKVTYDLIKNVSQKDSNNTTNNKKILISDLKILSDIYSKLWEITITINEIFEIYLIAYLIFGFIDFVGITFFLFKEQQNQDISTITTILCYLFGIVLRIVTVIKVTNDIKKNANNIGETIHLLDVSKENDTNLIILQKDFCLLVLFQPICIESVFYKYDLELIVPVRL